MPIRSDETVATECLTAWTTGDLDRTRSLLDEDVTFTGPLASTEGADDYMTGIDRMSAIVDPRRPARGDRRRRRRLHRLRPCHERSARHHPDGGLVPACSDGKVVSVRAFFDPRPLLSGT